MAVIIHDIMMCQELEWYHNRRLCICLIDYTSGFSMLYAYLIVILYIIYIECYMHDEILFSILD